MSSSVGRSDRGRASPNLGGVANGGQHQQTSSSQQQQGSSKRTRGGRNQNNHHHAAAASGRGGLFGSDGAGGPTSSLLSPASGSAPASSSPPPSQAAGGSSFSPSAEPFTPSFILLQQQQQQARDRNADETSGLNTSSNGGGGGYGNGNSSASVPRGSRIPSPSSLGADAPPFSPAGALYGASSNHHSHGHGHGHGQPQHFSGRNTPHSTTNLLYAANSSAGNSRHTGHNRNGGGGASSPAAPLNNNSLNYFDQINHQINAMGAAASSDVRIGGGGGGGGGQRFNSVDTMSDYFGTPSKGNTPSLHGRTGSFQAIETATLHLPPAGTTAVGLGAGMLMGSPSPSVAGGLGGSITSTSSGVGLAMAAPYMASAAAAAALSVSPHSHAHGNPSPPSHHHPHAHPHSHSHAHHYGGSGGSPVPPSASSCAGSVGPSPSPSTGGPLSANGGGVGVGGGGPSSAGGASCIGGSSAASSGLLLAINSWANGQHDTAEKAIRRVLWDSAVSNAEFDVGLSAPLGLGHNSTMLLQSAAALAATAKGTLYHQNGSLLTAANAPSFTPASASPPPQPQGASAATAAQPSSSSSSQQQQRGGQLHPQQQQHNTLLASGSSDPSASLSLPSVVVGSSVHQLASPLSVTIGTQRSAVVVPPAPSTATTLSSMPAPLSPTGGGGGGGGSAAAGGYAPLMARTASGLSSASLLSGGGGGTASSRHVSATAHLSSGGVGGGGGGNAIAPFSSHHHNNHHHLLASSTSALTAAMAGVGAGASPASLFARMAAASFIWHTNLQQQQQQQQGGASSVHYGAVGPVGLGSERANVSNFAGAPLVGGSAAYGGGAANCGANAAAAAASGLNTSLRSASVESSSNAASATEGPFRRSGTAPGSVLPSSVLSTITGSANAEKIAAAAVAAGISQAITSYVPLLTFVANTTAAAASSAPAALVGLPSPPYHRVQTIRYRGVTVWEKGRRVDFLGSLLEHYAAAAYPAGSTMHMHAQQQRAAVAAAAHQQQQQQQQQQAAGGGGNRIPTPPAHVLLNSNKGPWTQRFPDAPPPALGGSSPPTVTPANTPNLGPSGAPYGRSYLVDLFKAGGQVVGVIGPQRTSSGRYCYVNASSSAHHQQQLLPDALSLGESQFRMSGASAADRSPSPSSKVSQQRRAPSSGASSSAAATPSALLPVGTVLTFAQKQLMAAAQPETRPPTPPTPTPVTSTVMAALALPAPTTTTFAAAPISISAAGVATSSSNEDVHGNSNKPLKGTTQVFSEGPASFTSPLPQPVGSVGEGGVGADAVDYGDASMPSTAAAHHSDPLSGSSGNLAAAAGSNLKGAWASKAAAAAAAAAASSTNGGGAAEPVGYGMVGSMASNAATVGASSCVKTHDSVAANGTNASALPELSELVGAGSTLSSIGHNPSNSNTRTAADSAISGGGAAAKAMGTPPAKNAWGVPISLGLIGGSTVNPATNANNATSSALSSSRHVSPPPPPAVIGSLVDDDDDDDGAAFGLPTLSHSATPLSAGRAAAGSRNTANSPLSPHSLAHNNATAANTNSAISPFASATGGTASAAVGGGAAVRSSSASMSLPSATSSSLRPQAAAAAPPVRNAWDRALPGLSPNPSLAAMAGGHQPPALASALPPAPTPVAPIASDDGIGGDGTSGGDCWATGGVDEVRRQLTVGTSPSTTPKTLRPKAPRVIVVSDPLEVAALEAAEAAAARAAREREREQQRQQQQQNNRRGSAGIATARSPPPVSVDVDILDAPAEGLCPSAIGTSVGGGYASSAASATPPIRPIGHRVASSSVGSGRASRGPIASIDDLPLAPLPPTSATSSTVVEAIGAVDAQPSQPPADDADNNVVSSAAAAAVIAKAKRAALPPHLATIRVATFNILFELYDDPKTQYYARERIPLIIEALEGIDADVIGLQEVTPFLFGKIREGSRLLRDQYFWTVLPPTINEGRDKNLFNQVILSRYPILDAAYLKLDRYKRCLFAILLNHTSPTAQSRPHENIFIVANAHLKSDYGTNSGGNSNVRAGELRSIFHMLSAPPPLMSPFLVAPHASSAAHASVGVGMGMGGAVGGSLPPTSTLGGSAAPSPPSLPAPSATNGGGGTPNLHSNNSHNSSHSHMASLSCSQPFHSPTIAGGGFSGTFSTALNNAQAAAAAAAAAAASKEQQQQQLPMSYAAALAGGGGGGGGSTNNQQQQQQRRTSPQMGPSAAYGSLGIGLTTTSSAPSGSAIAAPRPIGYGSGAGGGGGGDSSHNGSRSTNGPSSPIGSISNRPPSGAAAAAAAVAVATEPLLPKAMAADAEGAVASIGNNSSSIHQQQCVSSSTIDNNSRTLGADDAALLAALRREPSAAETAAPSASSNANAAAAAAVALSNAMSPAAALQNQTSSAGGEFATTANVLSPQRSGGTITVTTATTKGVSAAAAAAAAIREAASAIAASIASHSAPAAVASSADLATHALNAQPPLESLALHRLPAILLGDFNQNEDETHSHQCNGAWDDAFVDAHLASRSDADRRAGRTMATYVANAGNFLVCPIVPPLRCDRITARGLVVPPPDACDLRLFGREPARRWVLGSLNPSLDEKCVLEKRAFAEGEVIPRPVHPTASAKSRRPRKSHAGVVRQKSSKDEASEEAARRIRDKIKNTDDSQQRRALRRKLHERAAEDAAALAAAFGNARDGPTSANTPTTPVMMEREDTAVGISGSATASLNPAAATTATISAAATGTTDSFGGGVFGFGAGVGMARSGAENSSAGGGSNPNSLNDGPPFGSAAASATMTPLHCGGSNGMLPPPMSSPPPTRAVVTAAPTPFSGTTPAMGPTAVAKGGGVISVPPLSESVSASAVSAPPSEGATDTLTPADAQALAEAALAQLALESKGGAVKKAPSPNHLMTMPFTAQPSPAVPPMLGGVKAPHGNNKASAPAASSAAPRRGMLLMQQQASSSTDDSGYDSSSTSEDGVIAASAAVARPAARRHRGGGASPNGSDSDSDSGNSSELEVAGPGGEVRWLVDMYPSDHFGVVCNLQWPAAWREGYEERLARLVQQQQQ